MQEIKELTIRGLEGEVARLVERHRQELAAAREQAEQQVQALLLPLPLRRPA